MSMMWKNVFIHCGNHESGLKNDKIQLLYISNKNANIAIKTSSGPTKLIDKKIQSSKEECGGGLKCTPWTSSGKLSTKMTICSTNNATILVWA